MAASAPLAQSTLTTPLTGSSCAWLRTLFRNRLRTMTLSGRPPQTAMVIPRPNVRSAGALCQIAASDCSDRQHAFANERLLRSGPGISADGRLSRAQSISLTPRTTNDYQEEPRVALGFPPDEAVTRPNDFRLPTWHGNLFEAAALATGDGEDDKLEHPDHDPALITVPRRMHARLRRGRPSMGSRPSVRPTGATSARVLAVGMLAACAAVVGAFVGGNTGGGGGRARSVARVEPTHAAPIQAPGASPSSAPPIALARDAIAPRPAPRPSRGRLHRHRLHPRPRGAAASRATSPAPSSTLPAVQPGSPAPLQTPSAPAEHHPAPRATNNQFKL
jgi:hypothetical protein